MWTASRREGRQGKKEGGDKTGQSLWKSCHATVRGGRKPAGRREVSCGFPWRAGRGPCGQLPMACIGAGTASAAAATVLGPGSGPGPGGSHPSLCSPSLPGVGNRRSYSDPNMTAGESLCNQRATRLSVSEPACPRESGAHLPAMPIPRPLLRDLGSLPPGGSFYGQGREP